jgi:hypothetical protein
MSDESDSAPITRATSAADERSGVMPRHEFLADGSVFALKDGTIPSIAAMTAAAIVSTEKMFLCFFK